MKKEIGDNKNDLSANAEESAEVSKSAEEPKDGIPSEQPEQPEQAEQAEQTEPSPKSEERLDKTSRFDGAVMKTEEEKFLPYTKTRISTIPLQAHPERVPVKKVKKKRSWKWFSFKRDPQKPKYKYDRDEYLAGGIKTVCLIVLSMIMAAFLAFMFLRGLIDIFALGKSEHKVQVELGEYCGVEEIADILHENGIIRYPTLFRLWAILKNDTNRNFEAGTYIVSPSMNYDDLLDVFVPSEYKRTEITIKIPEGSSVDDVIDIFVENGIGTREGFEAIINKYQFDTEKYWFLEHIPLERDPSYWRLEGFLYPDTYYFYSDSSELTAITKLLNRFTQMFKTDYLKNCEEQQMTLMEALTMASVITKETLNDVDHKPVASVLWNRLGNPDFGYLELDSPLAYLIRTKEGAYRELTDADRELASPFNTYKNEGLPPMPICSPTISAIAAALYPEQTDYYYFHLTFTEYCSFAETKEEYDAIVAKDLLDRENAKVEPDEEPIPDDGERPDENGGQGEP